MFKINLPIFVKSLQETLGKEQKLFWNYSFLLKGKFLEKQKNTVKQRKTAKMSYIWFWVEQLAARTPKSAEELAKYQFTKFAPLTEKGPKKPAKIILKLLFLT